MNTPKPSPSLKSKIIRWEILRLVGSLPIIALWLYTYYNHYRPTTDEFMNAAYDNKSDDYPIFTFMCLCLLIAFNSFIIVGEAWDSYKQKSNRETKSQITSK